MTHRILVGLPISKAKNIQRLGRKFYKDESLGINQAATVLLEALASGDYVLEAVKPKAPKAKVEEEKADEE